MAELTSREYQKLHFAQAGDRPLQIATLRMVNAEAERILRPLLKQGDRLRATAARCCAREASFVFSHWEGSWIVSKAWRSIAPGSVYSVNGAVMTFEAEFVGPLHPDECFSRRQRPAHVVLIDDTDDGEIPF